MRDPARIDDVLALIREIWLQYPDLRLGQLLYNAVRPSEPWPELYNLEESQLIRRLEAEVKRIRRASSGEVIPPDDHGVERECTDR